MNLVCIRSSKLRQTLVKIQKHGPTRRKPWVKMTASELSQVTAKYDKPFVALRESKPLSARGRELHRKAKPGRPPVGEGAAKIALSVERGLLRRLDAYAKAHGISRAELVARGLQVVLSKAS
jgi:hypothetical protein